MENSETSKKSLRLVGKESKKEPTIIKLKNVEIGGSQIAAIAGPCAVESEKQMEKVASVLKKTGVKIIRGGAYKPRTEPYSFQGLGEKGLKILRETAEKHDLAAITEVVDIRNAELIAKNADILQIGSRNMQNFELLKEMGKINKPVLLKRGSSATVNELLLAAEYILSHGNPEVILCERGIRTFEKETRNTLSLSTIPLVKELSHLPIIADPSHGTGKKSLVEPMTKAAIAAGADGFMIEVHPAPNRALSDSKQQLNLNEFKNLMKNVVTIAEALNRTT